MKPGDEIGGREIARELTPGRSWLARDRVGRQIFLKRLEDDCLSGGAAGSKLHPAIAQRLERIRELPEKAVANLHGVERDGELTYLVWDWLAGVSWADHVKGRPLTHDQKLGLARELVLAVQSLHLAGIVHGAIHGGNVIFDDRGMLRLVDLSPLLWTDEQADVGAVMELLAELFRDEPQWAAALQTQASEQMTLTAVVELLGAKHVDPAVDDPQERTRSLAMAGLAIGLGIAVTLAVWRAVGNSDQPPAQAATTR
jgi:serine/threonine protein kinase